MNITKEHKDVEYQVSGPAGDDIITYSLDIAHQRAFYVALSHGKATLDVVIYSEEGAFAYGGEDAVAAYREDPDASAHERMIISVQCQGRVP